MLRFWTIFALICLALLYVEVFWDTFALICLAFLCVEARAEAEGIDGEWEDYGRTLLCRDRIERLKQASSETQENQVESVMFLFCFFVLQKIKLQTNENGIEIFL